MFPSSSVYGVFRCRPFIRTNFELNYVREQAPRFAALSSLSTLSITADLKVAKREVCDRESLRESRHDRNLHRSGRVLPSGMKFHSLVPQFKFQSRQFRWEQKEEHGLRPDPV